MKHLLIIFTLLLTSVSWSKDVDYTDLIKRDRLYYEKFTDEPFTGNSTGLKQGKVKDGKKDGEWFYYLENGQLHLKNTYKDGKLHGERLKYYDNGKLYRKGNYKDGKRNGLKTDWHKNGRKESEGNWKNDKQEGLLTAWYENGQKRT